MGDRLWVRMKLPLTHRLKMLFLSYNLSLLIPDNSQQFFAFFYIFFRFNSL